MTVIPMFANTNAAGQTITQQQSQRSQDNTNNKVAAGTGLAGATAYQAKRSSVNSFLRDWFSRLTTTTKTTRQNAPEVIGLFGKFKKNVGMFTASIINKAMKFKDMKFIGPIINSPVTKGVASFLGVGMAFFALVTGIDKAYRNGKIAVSDIKDKLNMAA